MHSAEINPDFFSKDSIESEKLNPSFNNVAIDPEKSPSSFNNTAVDSEKLTPTFNNSGIEPEKSTPEPLTGCGIYAEEAVWLCENRQTGFKTRVNGALAQILKKYPADYKLKLLKHHAASALNTSASPSLNADAALYSSMTSQKEAGHV